jgi:hypothetical protein
VRQATDVQSVAPKSGPNASGVKSVMPSTDSFSYILSEAGPVSQ